MAEFLIGRNASVNALSKDDFCRSGTPPHIAVASGNEEMAKLLIGKGANVNAVSNNWFLSGTPLHFAIHEGRVELAKHLIGLENVNVKTTDNNSNVPLHLAAGDSLLLEVVDLLLQKDASSVNFTNTENWTPLHVASKAGNLNAIKSLIGENAEIKAKTDKGYTPLHVAASEVRFDVVKYLIDCRAEVKVKADDQSIPLDLAEKNNVDQVNREKVIKLLVEKLAELDNIPPLHWVVKHRPLEVVKLFMGSDYNINAKVGDNKSRYFKWTPLHFAVERGSYDIVKLLIDHEAGVDVQNVQGRTPLHDAVQGDKLQIVQLLTSKADINAKNDRGEAPLHVAAENGYTGIVNFLVITNKENINVDGKNINNETPLHLAAKKGNLAVVKTLIADGAETEAKDQVGRTPLKVAEETGDLAKDVVACLKDVVACKLVRHRRDVDISSLVVQTSERGRLPYVGYQTHQIQHAEGQNNAVTNVP
ncbi:MAG: Phosphocholine transferase AnkX [Wolbachia endosymbiont of Ctenocephalides orientis wCori]|nr:MAG: Phosphocholine transferase AnkX [Wolbachia endosymbiont of Ctenocephalides orientis wCori]